MENHDPSASSPTATTSQLSSSLSALPPLPPDNDDTGFDYEQEEDSAVEPRDVRAQEDRLPQQPSPPSSVTGSEQGGLLPSQSSLDHDGATQSRSQSSLPSSPSSSRSNSFDLQQPQRRTSQQWEPRSSTPVMGKHRTASSSPARIREPSPLSFGDRDTTPTKAETNEQPQPPQSAWKNMPGFEALDESWVENDSLRPGPATDAMRKKSDSYGGDPHASSSVAREPSSDALAASTSSATDAVSSSSDAVAASTPSATDATPSSTDTFAASTSTAVDRPDVDADGTQFVSLVAADSPQDSHQRPSRSSSRSSSSARKQQGEHDPAQRDAEPFLSVSPASRGPLSSISISTAPSDGLDHLRNRRPSWAPEPSPSPSIASESTSAAGVTASEGATFIHHSDVSDLPPILRPAWQKGPSDGALDPRTPGKKRSNVDLKDMFTPLKLQTMFETPSPDSLRQEEAENHVPTDEPPAREDDHTDGGKEAQGKNNGPASPHRQDQQDSPSDKDHAKPTTSTTAPPPPTTPPKYTTTRLAPHTVFTFRCGSAEGVPTSPFAHIGTPRSSVKKRTGLSAEAYAHLTKNSARTAPPSPFAMRLFRFAADKQAKSDDEARQLFEERVRQVAQSTARAQKHKRTMSTVSVIERDDALVARNPEPEKKRMRIERVVEQDHAGGGSHYRPVESQSPLRASTSSNDNPAGSRSPLRLSPRKLPPVTALINDESPRKIFRQFSAAGSVERELAAQTPSDQEAEDRWRDAELAALEERIRQRRLQRRAAPPARAVSDPPRVVVVDENGQSESVVNSATATATAPTSSDTGTWRTTLGSSATTSTPHMAHISPDAVPTQEMVNTFGRGNRMEFDDAANRWIKSPRKREAVQQRNADTSVSPSSAGDSTDPFKDIESFGSVQLRRGAFQRESTPLGQSAAQSTPQPQSHPPSSRATRTPPILQPRYALQRPGLTAANTGTAPRSGSALRNEVTLAESDESGVSAVSSGAGGDVHAADSVSDKRNLLSPNHAYTPAITPPRTTPAQSSTSTPRDPPRSILKSAQQSRSSSSRPGPAADVVTPTFNRMTATPRSISFADGKTAGKMYANGDDDGDGEGEGASPMLRRGNSAPREARIQQLLQELAALALGGNADGAEVRGLQDRLIAETNGDAGADGDAEEDSWQAPSPTSRFSQSHKTATPTHARTPLSFSRRSMGGRSVWAFDESGGDKTFLTQASFHVAHDRIVEIITDVVPWVPDWDDLKDVDLSGRRLESVLRLKEFLPNLESITLDDNHIEYLSGLPATLRSLSVAHNAIPATISFSHLRHLESLDISHNQVDDLSCLESLVHLRHLRADHNGIRSFEGVAQLEHLHTLSLSGNRLTIANLGDTSWRRLTSLDLSHNRLLTVRGLSTACRHLRVLNLTGNRLKRVDLGQSMPKLRVLRLSSNSELDYLDVLPARDLRTLYVDFCSLNRVEHLGSLSMLENLSARQERLGGFEWPVRQVPDLRRLFLSGNALSQGFSSTLSALDPFGLLVYLELSACQIETLPVQFSEIFPNVHQVNLDHNLLSRLPEGCFSGCANLRRVSMVGCRIKRTRTLVEAFEGCEGLRVLDTRMNPITLGLYPPLTISPAHNSRAFSAPMPNSEITRPDTAEAQRLQGHEDQDYEKSFFHKKHPLRVPALNDEEDEEEEESQDISSHDDEYFAATLPPTFALKRMLHRGSLGMVCAALEWLDGVRLGEEEVRKAEEFLLLQEE